MVDTELLEKRIAASGKKIGYLAKKIGVSRQYFNMKRNNKADFTNRETDILCRDRNYKTYRQRANFFVKDDRQKRKHKGEQ